MTAWFPLPDREEDILLLEPLGEWSAAKVYGLLTDPAGEEWRHKVGVAGRADGSGKSTTRLLCCRNWVLKTRTDEACASVEAAVERQRSTRAAGIQAEVWHPEKVWAVLRAEDKWYPFTVCRELATLRQVEELPKRLASWLSMIQMSLDVHRKHGLGLDLNPANFGFEPSSSCLFYLDEEFYNGLDERNIANAIAARIPEEPETGPGIWRDWAIRLKCLALPEKLSWMGIGEEIRTYPLPERYEENRAALHAILTYQERKSRRMQPAKLTCLLADVHGNLPALEAVLDDARSNGADSFMFLGDAIGYGPQPSQCIRRLAELKQSILLRGNHDHAIATGEFELGMNSMARQCANWTRDALSTTELAWLAALALEHVEEKWMAVHGAPRDPNKFLAYVYELTYDDNLRYMRDRKIPLCFHAHTHVQLTYADVAVGLAKLSGMEPIKLVPKYFYLVNPGSVGQPRDGDPRAAYAMWDRKNDTVTNVRVAYDVERTIAAIQDAGLPPPLGARLRTGR